MILDLSITQWIMCFIIYSFFGWILECTFVSIRAKRFVNRGFMHGPFIPIYGIGALICIYSSDLASDNMILTFTYSVVLATSMELATGLLMEKIFKVRYWNYTRYPLNIKGYVCPYVSLVWGVLSLLMNRYVQTPIAKVLLAINYNTIDILAIGFTGYFICDITISFMEAIHLRDTLIEFKNTRLNIQEYRGTIDKLLSKLEDSKLIEELKDIELLSNIEKKVEELIDNDRLELYMQRKNQQIRDTIIENEKRVNKLKNDFKLTVEDSEILTKLYDKMENGRNLISIRPKKYYSNIKKILLRNPDAISSEYQEEIIELKKQLQNENRK